MWIGEIILSSLVLAFLREMRVCDSSFESADDDGYIFIGEENAFEYNADLKMWVEKGKPLPVIEEAPPPPPVATPMPSQQTPPGSEGAPPGMSLSF